VATGVLRTQGGIVIKQRIVTALCLLPVLVIILGFASQLWFGVFLTGVLFLSLYEYNRMGLGDERGLEQWFAGLAGAAVIPILLTGNAGLLLPWYTFCYLLLAVFFLLRPVPIEGVVKQLGWLLSGFIYLPFLLGHAFLLRTIPYGKQWIFMLLIVVMACDSMAYFVGRKLGRRKLYPLVSPNKSVEGALGGIAGAVVGVYLAKFLFLPIIGLIDGLVIAVVISIAGQVGDLFESLLKRSCGVKDSGTMIPGHGGLLDRLDSLLFVFPLVYYIALYGYGG